jgi:DNA-binding response OmpR family regulator
MYRLLIAEDERGIRETIREFFGKRNFEVCEAEDGLQAIRMVEEQHFDIVLLDVMMPGADGFEVCRALRKKSDTPVMFLTARTAEEEQLGGFQLQADDYITKPFSLPVLHAKACALIQRNKGLIRSNILETAGIRIDLEERIVYVDGEQVQMPPKVYALLVYFLENRNRILTREQILDNVWGDEVFRYDRVVDTTIKKLRHLLGDRAECIKTIIKVGYKLEERDDE